MVIIQQVCLFSNQYYQLLELLQKKEKGTLHMGHMCLRKTKGTIMVERLDKGASIQLEKHGSNQHAIKVHLYLIL